MLLLSRHIDEVIEINGGFKAGGVDITIVGIGSDKVRIGIEAPAACSVHRREIADRIRRETSVPAGGTKAGAAGR